MKKRLSGKRALVTAAGQGIGRAVVEAFLDEGAIVVATDLDIQSLQSLESNRNLHIKQLDVTNHSDISNVVTEFEFFDILFNCAGMVHVGNILDSTENELDVAFNINVKSQYRLLKSVLPGMLEKGCGSIINVASIVSSVKSAPNRFVYTCTKAAVVGLTKAVAADFVSKGIRCNAICPGTIATPSLDERIKDQATLLGVSELDVQKSFMDRQPMKRLGTPQEVAALSVYLASDESSFTTGTVQIIDGGWSN
ncbi:SDR family oxidoreductase [Leeia sp. TBRC 13508]|uniref:SDR family oxidoreductase n=1 Tax=Leeia speluncae TaxID=2884804 RepID=A0ABS8DAY2_9NEIS|nr:SDR family oxidoreductase [Leeia speluncae]MCB6185158.1 SDR family oxidoreductase [Leeia speluncae]